jgi:AcrR family transcriptional regulator
MEFQRARSDEQREQRRRVILSTTAAMLTEMPVAQLSLNELSRRVGLAKSNVLRYFESREAILLELLDRELRDWITELEQSLKQMGGTAHERGGIVAGQLARSLAARPVMCDLISAQAAVLERNISTEVALRHKRTTAESVQVLVDVITRVIPELTPAQAYQLIAITLLMTSAAWPQSQPSEALCAAYAADPAVAATQMDFTDFMRQTVELSISGIISRRN